MQLFIKACIVALGILFWSTVIYAEKADEPNNPPQKILEDINQAIRLEPDKAELYRYRGVAHKKLGQYNHALIDFSRAIQLSPNDAASYKYRGETYSKLGQFVRAIRDFNRALDLGLANA